MASVVTQQILTEDAVNNRFPVRKLVINWTSDSSGNATADSPAIDGVILGVVFDPDATDAPTADYDITLADENGVDVLAGQGANLSASTSSAICPGVAFTDGTTTSTVPRAVCGVLSLSVSNAGSGKRGQVIVYYR